MIASSTQERRSLDLRIADRPTGQPRRALSHGALSLLAAATGGAVFLSAARDLRSS